MDHLPLNPAELGENVTIAILGFFVLFFIISPIVGGIMARRIGRRWAFSMITGSMVLTFSIVFVALFFFLLPNSLDLSADQLSIISMAVAFGAAAFVGVYARWWLGVDSGPSLLEKEFEELEVDMPFDARRREWITKQREMTGLRRKR
jgi:MFS family permease